MLNRFQYFNTRTNEWQSIHARYIEGVGDAAHLSNRLGNRRDIVAAINSIIDRPLGLPPGLQQQDPELWDRIDDLITQGGAIWDEETGMLIPSYSWEQIVNDFFDGDLKDFLKRIGMDNVRDAYQDAVQNILRRVDFVPDLLEAVRDVNGREEIWDQQDDDERFMRSLGWLMNNGREFAQGQTIFDVHRDQIDMRITQEEATFSYGMSQWVMTQYDILNSENDGSGSSPTFERPRIQDLTSEENRLWQRDPILLDDNVIVESENELDLGPHIYTHVTEFGQDRTSHRYIDGALIRFSTNVYNNSSAAVPIWVDFTSPGAYGFYHNNSRIFAGNAEHVVSGNIVLQPGWSTFDVVIYLPKGTPSITLGSRIGPVLNTTTRRWEGGQVHQMSAHRGNGRRFSAMEAGINIALDRIGIEVNHAEESDGIVTVREGSIITQVDRIRAFVGENVLNNHNGQWSSLEAAMTLTPGSILFETMNTLISPSNWDEEIHGPIPQGGIPTFNLSTQLLMHDGAINLSANRLMRLGNELHFNTADLTVDWNGITADVMQRVLDPDNRTHSIGIANMLLDTEMFQTTIHNRTIDLLMGNIETVDSRFEHGLHGWLLEWMGHDFNASDQVVERIRAMFGFDPESGEIRMGTLLERFNNFAGTFDSLEAALDIGPNGAGIGATIRNSIINSGVQNLISGTGNNGRELFHGWIFTGGYVLPQEPDENYLAPIGSSPAMQSISGHALWFTTAANRTGITKPILSELVLPTLNGGVIGRQEYTFQVWVRANVVMPVDFRIGILNLPEGNILATVGNEWVKITHTFEFEPLMTIPSPGVPSVPIREYDFSIFIESIIAPNTRIEHHGLMFNQGAILPNWSPSPADTAAQANRINMLGSQMNSRLDDIFSEGHLTPAEKQILRREFETIYFEREDLRRQYVVMRDLEAQIHNDLEPEDEAENARLINPMEKKINISRREIQQRNKEFNFNMTPRSSYHEDDEITPGVRGLEDVFISVADGDAEDHTILERVRHRSLEDGENLDDTYFIRNNDVLGLEQYRFESLWSGLKPYIGDHKDWFIRKEIVDHDDGTSEEIIHNELMPVMEGTSYDVDQEMIREIFNAYFDAKSQLAMAINERLDRKIETTRDEMADISSFLAESRTIWTGENIMNIVSGTELWSQTVNGQLTKNDLGGFLTEEVMREFWADVPYELRSQLSALDNDLRNFEVRTRNSLTNTFRNAGGVNFLQNSVGWNNWAQWTAWQLPESQRSINRVTGMSDTGRSTAIQIHNNTQRGGIWQTVSTTAGQTYTISYLARRSNNVNAGVEILDSDTNNGTGSLIKMQWMPSQFQLNAWEEHIFTFQAFSDRTRIALIADPNANVAFTALMMNVGDTAFAWTPHLTEVYNTNIVMDAGGIEVRQPVTNQPTLVTQMSPTRFAVMTRQASGDNIINTETFRAYEDGVTARNLRSRQSIWIGSGANNGTSNDGLLIQGNTNGGWSFLAHTINMSPEVQDPVPAPRNISSVMDNWLDMEGEIYL